MLIDFASVALKTKVITSSLCADGYGVENLINSKSQAEIFQPKFFMAEYFVKCPVKVLLEFPFLIDISYIVLNPRGTTHYSKVVEVHTTYQRPLKSNRNIPCSYGVDLADFSHHSNYLNLAGKYNEKYIINNSCGVSPVVFFNARHPIQYHKHKEVTGKEISLKPLASLSCCSHLILNITWATIPVIRSLEVWATVSQRNPLFLKDNINMLIRQVKNHSQTNMTSVPEVKPMHQSSVAKEEILTNMSSAYRVSSDKIPAEFLDSITMSLMTIPLLLPSGNNIDQTTYDKFVTNEQTYGRLPSDPFTGVVFHESTKPIPNTSLKLRIDEYLLKNKIDDRPKTYLLGSESKTDMKIEKRPYKRKHAAENASSTIVLPATSHKSRKPNSNHQSELEDSLNCALSETMFLIPSCVSNPRTKIVPHCSKCKNKDKLQLYILPCTDLICHLCLNACENEKKCNNCSKPFKHIEVKKHR